MDEGRSADIRLTETEGGKKMKSKDMEIIIEFEDVTVDEENNQIILDLQTEHHDFGFQKIIPITEDTYTKQKLRTHLEGMESAIAEEHHYGKATFDFDSCGFFFIPEEEEDGRTPAAEDEEGYTEGQLMNKKKDELIDIAEELELDTSGTKQDLADRILEAQE